MKNFLAGLWMLLILFSIGCAGTLFRGHGPPDAGAGLSHRLHQHAGRRQK